MYGVFPDLPGQCISVTYPRRNSLRPRDQKRIGLAEILAEYNIWGSSKGTLCSNTADSSQTGHHFASFNNW